MAVLYFSEDGINFIRVAGALGNVVGPASSTDNALARFNGAGGRTLQDSGVLIDDSDNVSGVTTLDVDVATGTAPLTIASTTVVPNLNVDLLDGIEAAEFLQRDGSVPLTSNWDIGAFLIRALNFRSDVATGNQPWITASTTVNTNLNADLLDGHHAAKFRRKTAVGFITNPTTAKTIVMGFTDAAATMVKVYAEVDTGTVDVNVEERAFGSADTAGTDTLTADLQANTTGATSVTFDNAGLAADSYLHLTISAKTGSPTKLTVVATYDLD